MYPRLYSELIPLAMIFHRYHIRTLALTSGFCGAWGDEQCLLNRVMISGREKLNRDIDLWGM